MKAASKVFAAVSTKDSTVDDVTDFWDQTFWDSFR